MRDRLETSSFLPVSVQTLWDFHQRSAVLERITPPQARLRILEWPLMQVGQRPVLRMRVLGPLSLTWIAEYVNVTPPRGFVDTQFMGPFRSWRHEHRFEPEGDGARLIDRVDYEPPGGLLGALANWLFIRRSLKRMFAYRHARTLELLTERVLE